MPETAFFGPSGGSWMMTFASACRTCFKSRSRDSVGVVDVFDDVHRLRVGLTDWLSRFAVGLFGSLETRLNIESQTGSASRGRLPSEHSALVPCQRSRGGTRCSGR